jgi:hypothetical protein
MKLIAAATAQSPSRGLVMVMLLAVAGLIAVGLLMWIFQVWRRSLRRGGPPRGGGGPGADVWATAGQRLRVDEAERDEDN